LIKRVRYYIFLKDVLKLSITSFGGPQAHFSMFFERLVQKRGYLNEEELIELNALCQIIPGPTSTQTITSIGFRIGGPPLAYLTLLVWILPAVIIMITSGIIISQFQETNKSLALTKYIQPMAVGLVGFAAYRITKKVVKTKLAWMILVVSAIMSFLVNKPYIFPILILLGGSISAFNFRLHPREEKIGFKIQWANFILWAGVLVFAALLGGATRLLPVLLFENFYRNGSLIFGGGQVLIPYLYTEFVIFKSYLSSQEFLSGLAVMQALPGPVFSFSAYIGVLAMREYGTLGEIVGGLVAAAGVFLPGTFLIFFVIRFWESLKKYRIIRASLEGINAASSGMIITAAVLLFLPLEPNLINFGVTSVTFLILAFTRIPAPFIILLGLGVGIIL